MKHTKWTGFLLAIILIMPLTGALLAQNQEAIEALETGEDPLAPIKTESPRDTMRSFMQAMNDYRRGVDTGDRELKGRIQDAIKCLNLEETNVLLREEKGREAAIFLKEVIDRVIVIDYDRIPDGVADDPGPVWRLRKTDIRIGLVNVGERAGEYLFTPSTVHDAPKFYQRVKDLPYLADSGQGAGYQPPWLESQIPEWMKSQFFYLNIWQWIGLGLAIFIGLVLKVLVKWLVDLLKKLARRSKSDWDDMIIKAVASPIGYLAASGFWYIALFFLRFEGTALSIFSVSLKIFLSIVVIWLVYRLTGVFSEYMRAMADKTDSTLDDQLVPLFSRTLKIIVVILGVLITIQNLGVNVLSLLAGLGIGGLAFALAARDTVANFFGSLMILLDRPFQVGDWIKSGSAEGTVEEIGFRSTRIRTFYNSVISVPNSELMNAHIDNMGMREFRRVVANLSVTYDTAPDKMEAFLEGIKNIIKANPNTRKDYFHVVFNDYGDSGLIVMLYFFLKVPDWSTELVERQNVFLEVYRLARDLGVEFAFPTRTLHMETFPEKKPAHERKAPGEKELRSIAEQYGKGGKSSRPGGQGIFLPPHKESGVSRIGGDAGDG
ncbi:MAG: mechanosensitive ion channel family protein [Leptospiraceae bacterium]|nr:mechanosensitive ion channel family protein [Leptospiraceae bacterium]